MYRRTGATVANRASQPDGDEPHRASFGRYQEQAECMLKSFDKLFATPAERRQLSEASWQVPRQ